MTAWLSVDEGRLRVSCDEPPFEWGGLLEGLRVLDLIDLRSGAPALVLLDPPAGHGPVRNLVGVAPDATALWCVELPTSSELDAFVSIEADEDGLISASTWSGYRVLVSPDTGATLRREFTK